MLKIILLPVTLVCFITASGQLKKSFELSLVGRYDQHVDYVTNFAGRVYNDTMKLFGLSSGVNIQVRKPLSPECACCKQKTMQLVWIYNPGKKQMMDSR